MPAPGWARRSAHSPRAGTALALCARRLDRLEALAAELCDSAAQVAVARGDVTDFDSVPVVFGKAARRTGRSGPGHRQRRAGQGCADRYRQGQDNLEPSRRTSPARWPRRRRHWRSSEQGYGHLVLISSVKAPTAAFPRRRRRTRRRRRGHGPGAGAAGEFAGKPIAVTIIEPGCIGPTSTMA